MTRIFRPFEFRNAAATEVQLGASNSPTSDSAKESPSPGRTYAFLFMVSQRCTGAARRWLTAVSDSIAAWCREHLGTIEFTIGDFCEICDDVHAAGELCPRAMIGKCLGCDGRWRPLDRFGNCISGHRGIVERRLRHRKRRRVAALLLAAVSLTSSAVAQDATVHLQHGHLVEELTTATHAFLAIQLASIPAEPQRIDYGQRIDFLIADGCVYTNGTTISRSVWTDEASLDGWLLLKLSKPCSAGERETDVGTVIVCPPQDQSGVVGACSNPTYNITPLFNGTPPELVPCAPSRRRAVRK